VPPVPPGKDAVVTCARAKATVAAAHSAKKRKKKTGIVCTVRLAGGARAAVSAQLWRAHRLYAQGHTAVSGHGRLALRSPRRLAPGTYTLRLTIGTGATATTRTIVLLVT
jgi:hypothetical protein